MMPDAKASNEARDTLVSKADSFPARPKLSFRFQIVFGTSLFFLLAAAIAAGGMVAIGGIEREIAAARAWESFLSRFEGVRQWETHFFGHGVDLGEAFDGLAEARKILGENLADFEPSDIPHRENSIRNHLDAYEAALLRLGQRIEDRSEDASPAAEIRNDLERHGEIVAREAGALVDGKLRRAFRWLRLGQRVPAYLLLPLFLLMIYANWFFSRKFMKPLRHLLNEIQRIARWNFTPIQSLQRYAGEFASMEAAINRMLRALEKRQKSLIESYKLHALGILTAGVAHELNNPINNIMVTAYSFQEEYEDLEKSEHMEMIADIISEADRSRCIVHNLLDFARESRSSAEVFDLGALVEEVAKLAKNQARVQGVPIHLSMRPGLPPMMGDQQKLKQVFLNLVMNAMDAVGEDGVVHIRVRYQKLNYLSVQVEDNGSGISPEVLPNIFDPFFTTKPVGKGTGLGLSVSRGIVDQHDGWIEVESEPGKFTVFSVILPYYPGWCPIAKE